MESVDFETIWAKGHTEAEDSGSASENFIGWVNDCVEAYSNSINKVTEQNGNIRSDDDAIYDLMGRRISNPSKGIYIQNGEKIVKK